MKYFSLFFLFFLGCSSNIPKQSCLTFEPIDHDFNDDLKYEREQSSYERLNDRCEHQHNLGISKEAFSKHYKETRVATIKRYCRCEDGYLDKTDRSRMLHGVSLFKSADQALEYCNEVGMVDEYKRGMNLAPQASNDKAEIVCKKK